MTKKKLIEVALPLEAINKAAAREKSIRHGHPSTLHLWWARRPLAAARAVIFSQMVDDPGSVPEEFPTPEAQEAERRRLFRLIEELVLWENTTNEDVLNRARAEITRSWARWCKESGDNPEKLPPFHDPFAGGGALPLEAQRLGLEAHASDLNPVAVLINKAMIEIPPRFAGKPPVNPDYVATSGYATVTRPTSDESAHSVGRVSGTSRVTRHTTGAMFDREWKGAQGLAEDVRYYGKWMRDEAEKRIGHLYPKAKVTAEMAEGRPDLQPYVGRELTVIAWLWARTVESSNPAYRGCQVPLVSSFWLSTKPGKEARVEPIIEGKTYRFEVRTGEPGNKGAMDAGTKLGRGANFRCILSQSPLSPDWIRSEAQAGRMYSRLIAIVCEGNRGRVYLSPTEEHETVARQAKPTWKPEQEFFQQALGFRIGGYGMAKWCDLFTSRQLVALTTFSDLVAEARERIHRDANAAGWSDQIPLNPPLAKGGASEASGGISLAAGGTGPRAYAEAVSVYLAFAVDKVADRNSTECAWASLREHARNTFGRQALPIVWDFAESNPLSASSGNFFGGIESITDALSSVATCLSGFSDQADAQSQKHSAEKVISTDPPYFDNVGYADLSDFFYIWLRQSLRSVFPDLFTTLAVPKSEELVATPARHGSKGRAGAFFLNGMTKAMHRLAEQVHPTFPVTIYYAFKQSEIDEDAGSASTGWETFLSAVIRAGFTLSGTWPMHTELERRIRGMTSNALASSIVLVCRPRPADAPMTTRKDFLGALRRELPPALRHLQQGNIAPVDLAQASIGPGMAVFSRYARILETDGKSMTVRTALQLINQTLDEVLAEQEGDFDPETAWAVAWFEQFGFNDGPFGDAETLSKAKNTALNALADAGVVKTGTGKTRLLRVDELPKDWDPATDKRLTVWEVVHHLVRVMNTGGETAAAELVARLGGAADTARELAYRLYSVCERKKRAADALFYNALVQSWPELSRLSRTASAGKTTTPSLPGME